MFKLFAHGLVLLGALGVLVLLEFLFCTFLGRAIRFGRRPIPKPPGSTGLFADDLSDGRKTASIIVLQPLEGCGGPAAAAAKEQPPGCLSSAQAANRNIQILTKNLEK